MPAHIPLISTSHLKLLRKKQEANYAAGQQLAKVHLGGHHEKILTIISAR
jgi:hypothetical protein